VSRCGECDNCKKLERVKASVLKVVNPPCSKPSAYWPYACADDGVIELWNTELARLPCEKESGT
jgi:hypothetical protein